MARESLCDAVESAMRVQSNWQTRVGDQVLAELTALRERFHAGSLGAKPYVLARLTVDIGKAQRELGYRPEVTREQGLQAMRRG